MSVDIGATVEEGGRRTLARNGLYLVTILWVLGVLNGLFSATIARNAMRSVPGQVPMGPVEMGPSDSHLPPPGSCRFSSRWRG